MSAFPGRGKLGALKLVRSEHCQEIFREMGQSWKPSAELFKKLQAFTCKLYKPVQVAVINNQPNEEALDTMITETNLTD